MNSKNTLSILLGLLALLALAGCGSGGASLEPTLPAEVTAEASVPETDQTERCTDLDGGVTLSLDEALAIAEQSVCATEGQLKETHFCNENSGTWWIDLAADQPGCNPACVVDVNTAAAEINWRCTGAVPPEELPMDDAEAEVAPAADLSSAAQTSPAATEAAPESLLQAVILDESLYVGWQVFENPALGYTVRYPAEAVIQGGDHNQSVQFVGPVVGNEHWPWFFVDHYDSDFFHPPAGTDIQQYLLDSGMPFDDLAVELRIANRPAVRLTEEASPQAYGRDDYYFIDGEQLYKITILHTEGRQDWQLYNLFLQSFRLESDAATPAETAEGWQGTIARQPSGSQAQYLFYRDDGETFVLDGADGSMEAEIDKAAWTGAQVRVTGRLHPLMSGHISIMAMEPADSPGGDSDGKPADQPRNLAPFAAPSASSELPADRLGSYFAWSVVDGEISSPWCEGASGNGVGQSLVLTFPDTVAVTHLMIDVGYDYSEDIFLKNNRVRQATLTFSDGESIAWTFEDERGLQAVPLARAPGPNIQTTSVTLTIEGVYPGTIYDDACIGEIEVWGTAK